jgi:hypothetical protein
LTNAAPAGTNDATSPGMRTQLACSLALLLVVVMNGSARSDTKEKEPAVGAQIRNVVLHLGNGVVLEVRELDGKLLSRHAGSPPVFDDIESYEILIARATVSMTPESLTSLMNNYVFADRHTPITRSRIVIENGQLKQTGVLRKASTSCSRPPPRSASRRKAGFASIRRRERLRT